MTSSSDPASAASVDPAWVAQPDHADALVREKTGRGWNDWVAAIDAGPGREAGHTAIAAWLVEQGVDAWWAQGVTVGYERITGLRLPGQMPDGTFTVSRSRVVPLPRADVRDRLLDDDSRAALLPDHATSMLSRPGVRTPRFELRRGDERLGVVSFAVDAAPADRTNPAVTHAKLASPAEAAHWKAFWGAWLERLASEEQPPA